MLDFKGKLMLVQSVGVFFLEEHKRLNIDVLLLYCPKPRLGGHLCSWNLEMWCAEHCTLTLETGETFSARPMVSSSFYATVLLLTPSVVPPVSLSQSSLCVEMRYTYKDYYLTWIQGQE